MADGGGFDPCECVWSHEQAMRRLISLLRSSQGYCTSDECFLDLPGPANEPRSGGGDTFMLFMMIWMILAACLYMFRPGRLASRRDFTKPSGGRDQQPPPPDNAIM